MTEDERVKEKEGISSPAGDENPEGGGREEEEQEDGREEQESVTEKETNQSFFLHHYPRETSFQNQISDTT